MISNSPSGLDRSPTGLDEPTATTHPEAPMQPVQQPPPDAAVPSDNAPPEGDDVGDVIPMEADDDDNVIDGRYDDEDDDRPIHPTVQLAAELLINGADAAVAVLARGPSFEDLNGPLSHEVERACSEFLEDRFERELASGVPEANIATRLGRMTSLLAAAWDATEDEARAWARQAQVGQEQVAQPAPVGVLRGLRAAVRPLESETGATVWFPLARGVEVHGVRIAGIDGASFDHNNVARVVVCSQEDDERGGESISIWNPDADDHPMGPYRLHKPLLMFGGSTLLVLVTFRLPSDVPFEVRPFGRMVVDTPIVGTAERVSCAPAVDLVVEIQAKRRMVGLQGLSFASDPHEPRPAWMDDICVLNARVNGAPIWEGPTVAGVEALCVRSVNARDHVAFSLFDALAASALDVGERLSLTLRIPGPVEAERCDLIVGVSGWAEVLAETEEMLEATTEASAPPSWKEQLQDLLEEYQTVGLALDSDDAHRGLSVGSIIRAFQIVPEEQVPERLPWNDLRLTVLLPQDIATIVRCVFADGNGGKLSRFLSTARNVLEVVGACLDVAEAEMVADAEEPIPDPATPGDALAPDEPVPAP